MPFVIVSGLPGSGTSTIAAELAARSGLVLYDKDRFLERRFAERRPPDRDDRRVMSLRADEEMVEAVSSTVAQSMIP